MRFSPKPVELNRWREVAIAHHSLDGILHNVKQDILLTEGEQDHLLNGDWIYRAMRELISARSVTARIFHRARGRRATLPGRQFGACARRNRPLAGAVLPGDISDQLVKLNVQRI